MPLCLGARLYASAGRGWAGGGWEDRGRLYRLRTKTETFKTVSEPYGSLRMALFLPAILLVTKEHRQVTIATVLLLPCPC